MPTRMVGLVCVLSPLVAPSLQSVTGARCLDQQSVPHPRGEVSHRPLRLEDGLEHDLVETLLLDLAVFLGLG